MDKGSNLAVDETVVDLETVADLPPEPLNIYQRINAVMAEVGGKIEKDGKVSFKNTNYEYVSHDAVTAHIRGALVKHGILPVSTVVKYQWGGSDNTVEMTVATVFFNVDNPDDFIGTETLGFGADKSDKGPGKALSYAIKSAYLKMFMLNSADDIEADNIERETSGASAKLADAQEKINKIDKTAVNNLNVALKGADSVELIDELMKDNKSLLAALPDVTKEHFDNLAAEMKRRMEEE